MDNVLYIALSRSSALRRNLDVVANNIANSNTAGFKGERMLFQEEVERAGQVESFAKNTSFVLDRGTYMDGSQGALSQTGNPLDIALQGDGWFGYETVNGDVAYGRDGRLTIDAQGNLTTMSGHRVLDAGGAPIAIPEEALGGLSIAQDGTITNDQGEIFANIGLFQFSENQAFEKIGDGLMRYTGNDAPLPAFNASVYQGFIESSNVQPIMEMTRMIEIQRAYDQSQKLTEQAHDLSKNTIGRLGRAAT